MLVAALGWGRNLHPQRTLVVMDPGVRRDDRSFHTPNVFAYRALMSSLCACTWAGSAFNNFKLDSGTCPPFSLTCAWNERWAKVSTSNCWASAPKKKLWNSRAAFGLGAPWNMPEGTMIRGEPSVAYTTSTGLPWSLSSTRL